MRCVIAGLLILFAFSCEQEKVQTLCDTNDPVMNLVWLKNLINEIKSDPKYLAVTISACSYQGQTLFHIQDSISSCMFCDLRDYSGQKYMPADLNDFIANQRNVRTIWCQNPDLCVN